MWNYLFKRIKKPSNIKMVNKNVTLDDLQKMKNEIVEEIVMEISKQLQTINAIPQNPMLRSSEVKRLLQCSTSKLETLTRSGALPYTKVLGTLYFKKEDVEKLFISQN